MPNFDIRPCTLWEVDAMCRFFHSYQSSGTYSVYSFAVYEDSKMVAAFAWQPPMYGAAKAVCPESPQSVLALSRMVAVPKEHRALRHISKPLRYLMLKMIDRKRWPVLITYHDESLGHTGHVYKCSGWQRTACNKSPIFYDEQGNRRTKRCSGKLTRGGYTLIHRWEHWICDPQEITSWIKS